MNEPEDDWVYRLATKTIVDVRVEAKMAEAATRQEILTKKLAVYQQVRSVTSGHEIEPTLNSLEIRLPLLLALERYAREQTEEHLTMLTVAREEAEGVLSQLGKGGIELKCLPRNRAYRCSFIPHDWSKDCERCTLCGNVREDRHSWIDPDKQRCAICSRKKDEVFDEKLLRLAVDYRHAHEIIVDWYGFLEVLEEDEKAIAKILSWKQESATIEWEDGAKPEQRESRKLFRIMVATFANKWSVPHDLVIQTTYSELKKGEPTESRWAFLDYKDDGDAE